MSRLNVYLPLPYYVFINKNKKRGRGKKRSEKGGKRKEEEARREEGTYMSFSASIFISAMLRLGVVGVAGSFSFSLFVSSGGDWQRGRRRYGWRGGRSRER